MGCHEHVRALKRGSPALLVAASLALGWSGSATAGGSGPPDPENRCAVVRARLATGAGTMSLGEAADLFDGNPATSVVLPEGEGHLELDFIGPARWLNHLEIQAVSGGDGNEMVVEYLDLGGFWVVYPGERAVREEAGTSILILDGPDVRAQGVRLRSGSMSGAPSRVLEITGAFLHADPDGGGDPHGRGGYIYHYDYVNDYSSTAFGSLSKCDNDARGLRNDLPGTWSWIEHGDSGAHEHHFKRNDMGTGNNGGHVDSADLAYWAGHGTSSRWDGYWGLNLSALVFGSWVDDLYVKVSDGRGAWGDGNMEWMVAAACVILTTLSDGYWATDMNGLHLMCGALSNISDSAYGKRFGSKLVDNGLFDAAWSIKSAWFDCLDHYNSSGTAVVIGETSAAGNDFIWGEGSVIADPVHDSIFTRWSEVLTAAAPRHGQSLLDRHVVHRQERYVRSSDPVVFPRQTENGITVEIDPSLLTSDRRMMLPVFAVQPVQVDEAMVNAIAASICDAEQIPLCQGDPGPADEGELALISGPYDLRVQQGTGRYTFTDTERWLGWWGAEESPILPNSQQAIQRAQQIMNTWVGGDLPGAEVVGLSYLAQQVIDWDPGTGGVVDPDSSHPVGVTVNFQRNLQGFPVGGPGGRLRITLGHQGAVQRVVQTGWRPVVQSGSIMGIGIEDVVDAITVEGWDACIEGVRLATESIEITSWEIGIYEPPGSVTTAFLRPCFIISSMLRARGTGEITPAEFYVWADDVQPQGVILSPPDSIVVEPGEVVSFEGDVQGGLPPYAFRWIDSDGGVIGSQADIARALDPLPPDETGEIDPLRTIEMVVTDSRGRSSHRFVRIAFDSAVGAESVPVVPSFSLAQNRPNPFNPVTEISFEIPESAGSSTRVRLAVYDVSGRLVRTLVAGALSPSQYAVSWDGRNDGGVRVPSGVYFYRLEAGTFQAERRMILIE